MRRLILCFSVFSLLVAPFSAQDSGSSGLPPQVEKVAAAAIPEYSTGANFDTILASGTSMPDPIVIARSYDARPHGSVFGGPNYPSRHLKALVSRSDFVGIGIPVKRWTIPNENNTFAVSVYLVHLTSVTIPGKEDLLAGQDVYVVRAGGGVTYKGHHFRAIDPDFHLFHLNEAYLFFGSQISPGVYKVDSPRTFKVEGNTLSETSVTHSMPGFFSQRTVNSVLNEAYEAWKVNRIQTGGAK